MLIRVVIGDGQQVRGIVVIEATRYEETESGTLIIYADAKEIGRWASGRWHSVIDVAAWDLALKAGVGDENSARRQATRAFQAV